MKQTTALVLTLAMLIAGAWLMNAQTLTGDQILAKASEKGSLTAQGSRINIVGFSILSKDGTSQDRAFAFFSKRADGQPDKLLIYFLAPELERGTIFLSVDPADPAQGARLWLYLSALGQVKELVSENDRSAGFAGSNLQNDQIGGGLDFSKDYTGKLLGQEAVTVNWLGQDRARDTYKVELTQKPDSTVDFPSGTVWVDTETFVVLRGELINKAGVLEQRFSPDQFAEFEGDAQANQIEIKNVLDNSQTTITISDRQAVDELPDEMFTPEALPGFDPAQFGVEG